MKTVNYKNVQKGFSPIFIVIILAVIGIGGFVLYNNSKNSQSSSPSSAPTNNNNQTQTSSQAVPGLDKVEGSNYVFYYPQGYMKLDRQRSSYYGQAILYYALPSKNDNTDEGISLTTEPLSTRNETPSSEYCNEGARFFAARLNKMLGKKPRVAEAKPVDFVKSHGCDYSLVFDDADKHLVFNYKDLWFKEGEDFSAYSVIASYLTSAPQTEINSLNLAVQNFMLK